MNNHLAPGPACAQFADLLPVLDDIAGPEAAAARAHLNMCAWCQAQQRADNRLEAALRRALGKAATPRLSTEDIMASLLDNEHASEQTPSRSSLRPRGVISGVAALAAVVLLAL